MKLLQIILACLEFVCCVLLVLSVIFQSGNKQGLGAIGGVSETFSKAKGKDMDRKLRTATIVISIIFVILCIALNIIALAGK